MLRLARAVHDTAHHGHLHLLHSRMLRPPDGHPIAQILLNVLGHLLKEGAGGPAASGTRGHLGGKAAEAEGLKDLLRHPDLFRTITTGNWRQRNPDGVADSLLQE